MRDNFLLGAGEHFGAVFDDAIQTGLPQGILAFSGKAEQLVGEVGGIHNCIFYTLQVFVIWIAFNGLQTHQGDIALDSH